MRKIWQQDVLRYLTNRRQKEDVEDPGYPFGLHLPLKNVRLDLHLGGDDAKLSRFVSRQKDHAYKIGFNAEQIFDQLIQPLIDEGRIKPEDALRNFHEFLWVEGIEDTWQDIPDYRECIIAAFTEGLQQHYPVEVDDARQPALHPQRFQPNVQFTGRQKDLSEIEEALNRQEAVILTGVGGIGKTVLAEEYARQQGGRYKARQMISAEPGFTSFRELILAVKMDGSSADPNASAEERLQQKMDILCSLDASSLLIFNNVDQELEDYALFRRLLRDSGAHIIVTTRRQQSFPEGTQVAVDALGTDEQLQFLSRNMARGIQPDEEEAAAEICRRVDGHTLTIQLIGRAIRLQKLTCGEMLERLSGLTGFRAFDAEVQVHKDDYNRTEQILRFIRELLFNLEPLDPAKQDILRYLTLLPLDGVQRRLLTGEPFFLDETLLEALVESGWVIHDSFRGTLRLHPVIREAVLAELTVDSNMCTPFLDPLDRALWEPEVSDLLPDLLRLAANAVDMLFISDALRRMLTSERLHPLFEQVYQTARSQNLWDRWQTLLSESAADPELTERARRTLEMYAAYCRYMDILDRARSSSGQLSAEPFLDPERTMEAVEANGDADAFNSTLREWMEPFIELYAESCDTDEFKAFGEHPEGLLQLASSLVGAELTSYLQESGLALSSDADPDSVPSLFTLLSRDDLSLLGTVSEPAYGSFLVTALEAFSVSQAFLPYVASSAIFVLTQLFMLLGTSVAQLQSLESVSAVRGWQFPELTYLPRGIEGYAEMQYEEELWGRPKALLHFSHGKMEFLVTISRPNREQEMDEYDLFEADVVEQTEERTILVRPAPRRGRADVLAKLGPWNVRIEGLQGLNRKEAVKIAEGLSLPAPAAESAEMLGV